MEHLTKGKNKALDQGPLVEEVTGAKYQKNLRDTLRRSIVETHHTQGESSRALEKGYEEKQVD